MVHKEGFSSKVFMKYFSPHDLPGYFLHLNGSETLFKNTKDSASDREEFLSSVNQKIKELYYTNYYPVFIKHYGMYSSIN